MTTRPKPRPLPLLVTEVRRIANLIDRVADTLHAASSHSTAARELLETIALGPATVADLAERRGVTHQHVQALVDQLLKAGLVAERDHLAHKRSTFVVATTAGADALRQKLDRESPVATAMDGSVSKEDALMAMAAIVRLRERLEMFVAGGAATGQPAVRSKHARPRA